MNFRMKHLIFPVRKECRLAVQSVFPVRVNPDESYTMRIFPLSGLRKYGLRNTGHMPDAAAEAFFAERHTLSKEGEELILQVSFPQEDQYICRLYAADTEIAAMEVYALEEDLFPLNPYKGDNHLHTYFSDGKDSPMYMAAAACRFGYDYCLITDHHKYTGRGNLTVKIVPAPCLLSTSIVPPSRVTRPLVIGRPRP